VAETVACASANAVRAESTVFWAVSTAVCASPSSILASTCPAVAASPALTFSSVTVPPVPKDSPRVAAACTVPAAEAVWVTVPRCTVAVAVDAAVAVAVVRPVRSSATRTAAAAVVRAASATNRMRRPVPPRPGRRSRRIGMATSPW